MGDAAEVRRMTWWIGVLFAVGSTCFLVGPFPGFVELVGSEIDGVVFFVGSIFFTSAATLQYVEGGLFRPRGLDWWSNVDPARRDALLQRQHVRRAPDRARRERVRPPRVDARLARLDLLPRLGLPRLRRRAACPLDARLVDRPREPRRLRRLRHLGGRGATSFRRPEARSISRARMSSRRSGRSAS